MTQCNRSEAEIQDECLLMLSEAGMGICWRQNAGKIQSINGYWVKLGPTGIADIVGLLPGGQIYFIECKKRTGKQRKAQIAFQKAVEKMGAIYILARAGQQAVDGLRKNLKAQSRAA